MVSFLNSLEQRGFIHQCTDRGALQEATAESVLTGYIGFDATAPSLHVGSLVQIMMLRQLQQHGHKPIVLIGGGTTKVGDPTGKDEQRSLLSDDQIRENSLGIRSVFEKFLVFGDGPTDALLVDNDDWLSELRYVDFLRDFGVHFTINRMLTFDSVKLRLDRESPLTFLEFNYMLMQAYDYYELNKRFGCRLQMGGSDQWGNIVNGIELCRRVNGTEVFGLTTPLLSTSSGKKMGKTEEGAVWLNADRVSPYDYWQYWRNTEDSDVGRFLKLFTELPLDEISRLEALEGQEINDAKKILATEATSLLHGKEAADSAAETARSTFEHGIAGEDLPKFNVPLDQLKAGLPVIEAFRTTDLGKTNGEIRRHIKGGGAKVNDKPVNDEKMMLTDQFLNQDGAIKLSIGKKRHALILAH